MALVPADAELPRRVLTWGRAQHGQLGHGSREKGEVSAPGAVGRLEGRPVSQLACGQFHSAAIVATQPPVLLTWGRGTLGVLGHGDEDDSLAPRAVEALKGCEVRQASCGAYQTAAVTRSGELFCWGWQFEDGPGGSIQEGYTGMPQRVSALDQFVVRTVACGHYATAALTTDGALFTWGKGDRGQLGHGTTRDVSAPTRVGALAATFVWDAKFGKNNLLTLTAQGELFANGCNDGGALGVGTLVGDERAPRRLEALSGVRVTAIACGDAHGAAVGWSGDVYTWGRGGHGQLGLGHTLDVPTPTRVEAMVGKVAVEIAASSFGTSCRTDAGHVWQWGGSAITHPAPARVRLGGSACALGAGGGHVAVALGEPLPDAAEQGLARQVGMLLPPTRAAVAESLTREAGPTVAALVEHVPPPDADPTQVLAQLQQLRALLQAEEHKRDTAAAELDALQAQLQQVVFEQELMREQRGAPEPAQARGHGPVGLIDTGAYAAMLPEEQVELNLFGFRVSYAVTAKPGEPPPPQQGQPQALLG